MSTFKVTKPGVYDAVPEDVYHGDPCIEPSLSSSEAKKLAGPLATCPAKMKYERVHPKEPSAPMLFGRIVHELLLQGEVKPQL